MDVLPTLAGDQRVEVRKALAWNPQTPAEVLRTLVLDEEEWKKDPAHQPMPLEELRGLAPDANPEHLLKESLGEYTWVLEAVAKHPQTPVEVFPILAQSEDKDVREQVAGNEQTPITVLQTLLLDKDERVRRTVAENPQLPMALLQRLAQDQDVGIRRAVARNEQTPIVLLRTLAQDASWAVRAAAVLNPHTPAAVVDMLAQDEEHEVRWVAGFVQRQLVQHEPLWQNKTWRERFSRVALIKRSSVEEQLYWVDHLEASDALRQALLEALAVEWDAASVRSVFLASRMEWPGRDLADLLRAKGEQSRRIMAPFMPPIALQKLAACSSWEIRYLVALHEQTPSATRQRLSQDGNRYVRAIARARMKLLPDQAVERTSV